MEKLRVAVRVFVQGGLRSEEYFQWSLLSLNQEIPRLAEKHALLCLQQPTMIELEFLDEPDPQERFFRIGTDPRGMVQPTAFRFDPTKR